MRILEIIKKQCRQAIESQFSGPDLDWRIIKSLVEITPATHEKFGHYQCNSAMKLAKLLHIEPRTIANQIKDYLINFNLDNNQTKIFSEINIAGPGFINFTLSAEFLITKLKELLDRPLHEILKAPDQQQVIIDFSSPNIAKEMHVGHLRSTIIGDSLAKILEFTGHKVVRLNHTGDWGTQFGMLIAYLNQQHSDFDCTLSQLVQAYKKSKHLFDNDPKFKQQAQQEVVKLQSGNTQSIQIWEKICNISRIAFQEIYDLLDVQLIERGESFYNPYLADLIDDLEQQNLIKNSDGAKCIFLDKITKKFTNRQGEPLPLIVQKKNGAYNYASTDLAALRYRIQQENATWLIYVVDAGQSQHFEMVFECSKLAGYLDPRLMIAQHVPFGLVLREDGKKFKTREGETERLIDLLNNAINKAKDILQARDSELKNDQNLDDIDTMAKTLGINAVKYADLSTNRTSNYVFNYDRMLQFEGNTAAFLSYAYVRIQSIKRKANINNIASIINITNINLTTEEEINLCLQICQFPDAIIATIDDMLPHRLTDYLYKLAEKFHSFFHSCQVTGSKEQNSRLILCEATSRILKQGFDLLGLKTMEKM